MTDQETTETQEIPQETVNRALEMGWIPKEEFKGDESKWRPADEYVDRAENLMPILKSQLKKFEEKGSQYQNEISELKSTIESQKKTTEKLVQMSSKVGQQAYERAKRDLQSQQAQAVADGDVQRWQQLEDQKDKLEKPEEIKVEPTQPENPVFNQWKNTNSWYGQDQDVSLFADSYGETLKRQNPTMAYQEILQAVETKVKDVFPHKFENFNRQQETAVDTSTQRTQTTQTGRKTYNNLPADAKAQCDAFVADGTIKSREDYVKDFFGLEDEMKARREQLLGG